MEKDENYFKIPKWIVVLSGILGLIMLFKLKSASQSVKSLKDEQSELKKQFQELLNLIGRITNLTEELKARIELLIRQKDQIPNEVIAELILILSFINNGHFEQAIAHLSKIIENQLKLKYQFEPEFFNRKKKPTFHEFIEHAKNKNFLSKEEFHYVMALKEVRNQAFHELDVTKDEILNVSSLFIGIGLIVKLNKPKGLSSLRSIL